MKTRHSFASLAAAMIFSLSTGPVAADQTKTPDRLYDWGTRTSFVPVKYTPNTKGLRPHTCTGYLHAPESALGLRLDSKTPTTQFAVTTLKQAQVASDRFALIVCQTPNPRQNEPELILIAKRQVFAKR